MSTIQEAKYLDGFITIDEYNDKLHYQKIYCPECFQAPIHIVRREKGRPFFASNRKEEHLEDCQHYEEFIKREKLNQLIESNKEEDQERIAFLIKKNMNSALRLLLKNNNSVSTGITPKSIINQGSKSTKGKRSATKGESILRINIKNIKKRNELLNNYVVIYGRAQLEVREREPKYNQTNEEYFIKQLFFKINNKLIFSIFLSKAQTEHFHRKVGAYNIAFAVFGFLFQKESYINLKVNSTKNIEIIDE